MGYFQGIAFAFRKHSRMSSREGEQTAGEVEETEPEAGETQAEAENETDKVKPVIYIGLTLTFLLCLGKHVEYVDLVLGHVYRGVCFQGYLMYFTSLRTIDAR